MTTSDSCQGEQDDLTGEYVCTNENVATYRARAPWSDKWITVRWCDAHAEEARSHQYGLQRVVTPHPDACDCRRCQMAKAIVGEVRRWVHGDGYARHD